MTKEFKCTFCTPQGSIYNAVATSVTAPGLMGQFTVLAKHELMVVILKPGILLIRSEQKEYYFAIDSGSLEVSINHDVVILSDKALEAKDAIDASQKVLTLETPTL